jgi:hypothetical protein
MNIDECPWCGELENWLLLPNGERECNRCGGSIGELAPLAQIEPEGKS